MSSHALSIDHPHRQKFQELTSKQNPNNMPPMLQWAGDINAGFPSAAEGYEDQPLDLHGLLIAHPAATFFFWVKGNVLRHEHIRDGSMLIVDRSVNPRHGKLVLVEHEGAFIVCRFRNEIPMQVCGVVVAAIHRF